MSRTTIRNIDPRILIEAREIVRNNPGLTMGEFMSDALEAYIDELPFFEEDCDEAVCEASNRLTIGWDCGQQNSRCAYIPSDQ